MIKKKNWTWEARSDGRRAGRRPLHSDPVGTGRPALVLLLGLVHVLDAVLHHHQVRSACAVDLDAVAVIPLDDATQFLAVLQDDDHRSPGVHLLEVVERLGVRLVGWNLLAAGRLRSQPLLQLGQVGPDQLAVHLLLRPSRFILRLVLVSKIESAHVRGSLTFRAVTPAPRSGLGTAGFRPGTLTGAPSSR